MGENELYQIAFHFREAIVAAKTNGEFNFRDRMHRFPGGCCDDTCDLLGFYLWEKYRIHTSQRNGYYEAEMTNHAWLITDDRIIIDITGDQFYGAWKSVYVGQEVGTYKKLSRIITQDNFRFLYKGIIIKHNKTEPTYTKTSLFLCEKRRFFMARTEKGVVTTI